MATTNEIEEIDDELETNPPTVQEQVLQYAPIARDWFVDALLKSPTVVVRTLIQLGHEPSPAEPHVNLFGQHGFLRPNFFRYAKSICINGDYTYLLTGLQARLCLQLVLTIVKTQTKKLLLENFGEEVEAGGEKQPKSIVGEIAIDTASSCVALAASYPFEVVGVNMIAQLVGGETRITGTFSGLYFLYSTQGFPGLYRSIIPACIGEATMVVSVALLKVAIEEYLTPKLTGVRDHNNVMQQNLARSISTNVALLLANPLFYPFNVVRTIMIINGNGLKAGMPPTTELFGSWTDCLGHLYQLPAHRGLQRGVSNLRRFTYVE
eukprot:m.179698 g.179698  ORF g.179698 m.179698 type:complete len:322 (-) comp31988_c0_seq2:651-1616(-)